MSYLSSPENPTHKKSNATSSKKKLVRIYVVSKQKWNSGLFTDYPQNVT